MRFGGGQSYQEPLGDLGVAETASDEGHHLARPGRQFMEQLGARMGGLGPRHELGDHEARNARRKQRFSSSLGIDGAHERGRGLGVAIEDLVDSVGDIGRDDVGLRSERTENHARPRDEGRAGSRGQGTGNIPGVSRDQAEIVDRDPEALRRGQVGGRGGFERTYLVS